jgi:hypothetical protein
MLRGVNEILKEIGSKYVGQSVLEVSAGLGVLRGEWQLAARLYGAAEALALETGVQRDPADEAFLSPLVAAARRALDAATFAAAEREGRASSYETVMTKLRAWLAAS